MQGGVVTVSDKWQVVIPKKVRDKLKIKPKDKAIVFPMDSFRAVVEVVGDDIVRRARGALKKYDPDGKGFARMLRQKREDLRLEDRNPLASSAK